MKRFALIAAILVCASIQARDLFLAKRIEVTGNWFTGTRTFTFTDDYYRARDLTRYSDLVPMTDYFAISMGFYAGDTHEYQVYGTKVAGVYLHPTGSEETATVSGDSFYPAGNHIEVTYSDRCICRISNATGASVSIGDHSLSSSLSTLPAQYQSAITISGTDGSIYYLVDTDNGTYTQLNSGYTANLLIGNYTIIEKRNGEGTPTLIVNDIKGDGTRLLFGKSNQLIYQFPVFDPTNLMVYTEWAYDENYFGSSTKAYINGEEVCPGHSTTHIIAYQVFKEGSSYTIDSTTKEYVLQFTMTITVQSGYSGGSCVFRCWCSDTTFDNTEASRKAAKSGTHSTVATFELRFNRFTGAISLKAL